jgi:hypothetical protein
MGVRRYAVPDSEPKRMVRLEIKAFRRPFIHEGDRTGRCRVPRVRRNHVERGSQLCFEQLIHALCSCSIVDTSPLASGKATEHWDTVQVTPLIRDFNLTWMVGASKRRVRSPSEWRSACLKRRTPPTPWSQHARVSAV